MTSRKPSGFILASLLVLLSLATLLPSLSSAAVLTGYKGMRWTGNPNQGAIAVVSPLTYATFEEAYAYTAAHASDPLTPTTGSWAGYYWANAPLETQSFYQSYQGGTAKWWYFTQVFPSPYSSVSGTGTWPTAENDICGNFSAGVKEARIGANGLHYRHGQVKK